MPVWPARQAFRRKSRAAGKVLQRIVGRLTPVRRQQGIDAAGHGVLQ